MRNVQLKVLIYFDLFADFIGRRRISLSRFAI